MSASIDPALKPRAAKAGSRGQPPLRLGIAGLGTVGVGVVDIVRRHGELLEARSGRAITVEAVSARDRKRDRGIDVSDLRWVDNALDLASDPDIDVVVEMIGGESGVALDLVRAALDSGKHVVTANKALLAHHGGELALRAEEQGVALSYEAAVAGGIPIVKALREGLAGNGIERVYGILNGTCNYILTTMRDSGRDFADVLEQAQELGYAETDPSFDVDGIDAAHKLALLSSLAFGCKPDFNAIHVEGIRHVSALDLEFATEFGYRIKLLGVASMTADGLAQRVHPCMVPLEAPIANVEGVYNAVVAEGDSVGSTMYQGQGAGRGPTASAVVADLVDIARGHRVPVFSIPGDELADVATAEMAHHFGAYYIRLMVLDRPGVLADVAAAFRDNQVSMESLIQRGRSEVEGQPVPVVFTTHETEEAGLRRALEVIAGFESVIEPPRMIRIERYL